MALAIERHQRLAPAAATRFAAIYEASFPPSERDETSDLVASIDAGERLCYLAARDGTVVGIAVAFALDGGSIAFLEYLAVDPSERNAGVGGAILDHLRARLGPEVGATVGMVWEVEPPLEVEGAERALRERRIEFYKRHSASVVECAPRYRAPNLESDDEVMNYTLMWVPLAVDAAPTLTGDLLHRCVTAILTQSYGLASDDPLVQAVLDDLAC